MAIHVFPADRIATVLILALGPVLPPGIAAQDASEVRIALEGSRRGTALSGQAVAPAPTLRLLDADGVPLEGAEVEAFLKAPTDVAGLRVQGSGRTDPDGTVIMDDLVVTSPVAIPVEIGFRVDGEQQVGLVFRVAVETTKPVRAIFLQPPVSITPGVVITPALEVELRNKDHTVAGGIPVRIQAMGAGLRFDRGDAVTGADGVARFPALVLHRSKLVDEVTLAVTIQGDDGKSRILDTLTLLVASATVTTVEVIAPFPHLVRAGERLPSPLRVQVRDSELRDRSNEPVTLTVVSGTGEIRNPVALTNDRGMAQFDETTVHGPAGTITVSVAAGGKVLAPLSIQIVAGPPRAVEILQHASPRTVSDSIFVRPIRVRVVDGAGNGLAEQEVRAVLCLYPEKLPGAAAAANVAAERKPGVPPAPCRGDGQHRTRALVLADTADLIGPVVRRTGKDGEVWLDSLGISGRPGTYLVELSVTGCADCIAYSNPISYDPNVSLNRNYIAISAIKSVAGQIPDDEFFDIRMRLRLTEHFFVSSASDIALSARGTDSTRSTQRKLTEASISLNYNWAPHADPRTGEPERVVFIGAIAKVFNTLPYMGIHVGSVELAGSPLQGSQFSIGPAFGLSKTAVVVQGNTVRPQALNVLAEFLIRSDHLDFFKSLNIRGSVLLPVVRGLGLSSRIGIAVPVGTLHVF